MPIDEAYLPSELHYIIPLAEQHGSDARVADFNHDLGRHVKYGETLSADAIEPLRKLYTEIRGKGHGSLINSWHHDRNREKPCPSETSWPIYGLLCLFNQLGKLGIAPFNDGAVRPESAKEVFDWSKLPPNLAWLAAPAERYGHYQFDEPIWEFVQNASPAELAELRAVQERWEADFQNIDLWLDEFNITKHPEARLVYFTQVLLGTAADMGRL